ncbi:alpha/beta hydrolase [Actinoplanes sp. RD1]|uniref:alpha/beta hydrolase n=1 Tax=Actinoplanes sp. RD1 TaxID=3064538 RepID=UPI002740CE47|nr:alpha/beta hydrolase [Actinoplanes sp. RD1]
MRQTKKITTMAAAVVVTVLGLTACEAADDEDTPAVDRTAAAPQAPAAATIAWGACPELAQGAPARDPRQKCGVLRVPLDYKHPDGPAIDIAVSRLSTGEAGAEGGTREPLLVNPGGPALPGLDTPSALAPTLPPEVLAKYDLIGFDPRGVERSTPQTCGLGDVPNVALFPYPAADGSIAKNVEFARTTAQKCASNANLKFFTTANTARDMDRIREALGADRIAYWGQSYGTYLGAAYDMLFPQRTDKMVLEGNVDPAKAWAGEVAGWGKGMSERFPDAAAVAAKQTGRTPAQVTKDYLALAARLDAKPATIPGTPMSLDGALLRNLTYAMLLHNETLPVLPKVWQAAAHLADGKLTDADTAVIKEVFPGTAPTPGVPADNAATMFLALMCGDVAWPAGVDGVREAVEADRARWPLTAGMPVNAWTCAFWPGKPLDAPIEVTDQGARNVMVLQNRRDNATPWDSGVGLRTELGGRAVLVGVDNGGHYVYHAGSACADRATVAFLAGGTLPTGDVTCDDVTSG